MFDINLPNATTHCLFLTLTYDTKLDDRDTARQTIYIEYNRAVTRLRRKYGQISILRVWEASKKGYPHIHAILLFHDSKFKKASDAALKKAGGVIQQEAAQKKRKQILAYVKKHKKLPSQKTSLGAAAANYRAYDPKYKKEVDKYLKKK